MIPDIAKLQNAIDEMVQTSLSVSKMIPRWNSKGDYFATVLQSIPPIQFITKDSQIDNAFQTITLTKTQLDQNVVTDETVEMKKSAAVVWSGKGTDNKVAATARLQ